MKQYLALLRGINVGGKNIIPMSGLRACLEALGYQNVRTYIQSGNVIFEADAKDKATLTAEIERALSAAFGYEARVVVRSQNEMEQIVTAAPEGFGSQPALYRYDVIFLKEPLTAAKAMKELKINEGVDQAFAGPQVLYFSRLFSRITQSHLTRLNTLAIYQSITVRNWGTTTKLVELMRETKKRELED